MLLVVADIIAPVPSGSSQVVSQYFRGLITNMASSLITTSNLRLGTIICGYLLLRPYLLKLGAPIRASKHDRFAARDSPEAQLPNTWRDQCISKTDEGDSGDGMATNWGRRARRRQRGWVTRTFDKGQTQGYVNAL